MYSFEENWAVRDEPEMWRLCTYPNVVSEYEISSYGRVRNITTGRILKLFKLVRQEEYENVYYIIKLKSYNQDTNKIYYKNYRVNRLVAWEYCRDTFTDISCVACHLNDNKLDNYYKNLKFVSHGENTRDALQKGRIHIYDNDNPSNVYSVELVNFICKMMEDGKSNIEILKIICGKNSNIHTDPKLYSLITHLRKKDRFTHIAITYNYKPKIKLTDRQKYIIDMMKNGKENIEILKFFGGDTIKLPIYHEILTCRKILYILNNDISINNDIV